MIPLVLRVAVMQNPDQPKTKMLLFCSRLARELGPILYLFPSCPSAIHSMYAPFHEACTNGTRKNKGRFLLSYCSLCEERDIALVIPSSEGEPL